VFCLISYKLLDKGYTVTVDGIQRSNAYKIRAASFILFSILGLIFSLFSISSVYGVDFSCPGGQWVVIQSCSSSGGSCGTWYCEEIIGNIKYANTYWPGTDPTYPCYSPPPCNTDCPTYCYPPSPYLNCGTLHSSISEWQCPAVCTDGQTQACSYTGPPNTENVGECKAGTQTCVNGQWGACEGEVTPVAEICGDGKDNNCNGQTDEGCCVDNDGDGYFAISPTCPQGNDCNDNDASIHPGAPEICGDDVDNNCNGQKDETCSGSSTNLICLDSAANAASGNFYHSQTLFTLTNAKPSIEVALSYNSLDTVIGLFGKGWTHNYNILVTQVSDTILALKGPDGNSTYFRLSNGVYLSEPQSGDSSSIVKNPDNTYTQTYKDGIVYTFNISGLLTQIKDRNGNTTTLNYIGSDLTSIIDSTGRSTSLTLSSGKIMSVTDSAGAVYTFTYTGALLTAVTNPLSNSWTYGYDGNGRMTTKTDPAGNTITYAYDAQGKLISSTDPKGKTKTITYDQINNIATILEKDGGIWLQKYDPLLNVPKEKTDPDGNKTTYTYDSNRNLLTETDPLGHVTTYTYDSNRNITSVTDALGKTTSYTYNSLNKVTSITDQIGNLTTFDYDEKGNLLLITDPEGGQTHLTYDSRGNIISIRDPLDQITIIEYDSYNTPVTIKDPTETVFKYTYSYDIMGNMLSSPNPPATYEYNSLNQLTKITDNLGYFTEITYDRNGNRETVTDAEGNTTRYEHNYRGQVTKITDALNNITTLVYGGTGCPSCGGADKLTSVTDAKGNTTTFQYDLRGNLKKEIDPLGYETIYTYNEDNNLKTKTDANGNTTTYDYDDVHRLTKKTYPNSTTETFTYDEKGNILTATNTQISYTFTYDKANRLTSTTDSSGKTISYQYYPTGNRKQMTLPEGRIVTYTYDPANRPTQLESMGDTFTITYDTLGKRTSLAYPNGINTTYAYDEAHRLTNLLTKKASTTIDIYTYVYDKIGNRKTITDKTGTHNYTYDKIYQLTQATHPTIATEQFTYDPVGNRTGTTVDAANRLMADAAFTYTYDNNGSLTKKKNKSTGGTTQYFWDYENRLKKVIFPDATTAIFKYDPFGRRIRKNMKGVVTNYLYDGEDIVTEYNSTGAITAKYTHGPGIDEPLSDKEGGLKYYYHADALGSVKRITDSSGSVIRKYTYNSYGNIASQTGALIQPYKFTGREHDSEIGMYFYRGRHYFPKAGRFISKDPIGFAGGDVNLYRYVGNNPVNFVDPLGLITAIFEAGNNRLTIFSNEGDFLGQYDARNLVTRGSKGEFPPGIYDFGEPRGPRGETRPDTGNWFIPILNVHGRIEMGLHGGGSGLKDPFATNQGWVETQGCIRVQNQALEEIASFIQQDIANNKRNRIIIIPNYPKSGFGR